MPEAIEFIDEETKTCRLCGVDKPLRDFYLQSSGKTRQGACIVCYNARYRAKRAEKSEPERARGRAKAFKYHLKKYDLTVEEYEAMHTEQHGVCAICGEECKTQWRLSVDHDHETGENRGLLCQGCNFGIGHFGESISSLYSAVRYLEKYSPSSNDDINDRQFMYIGV